MEQTRKQNTMLKTSPSARLSADSVSLPVKPSTAKRRDPGNVLLTAARVLTAKYGHVGTDLAMYICAHCLNGTRKWPRTVTYYRIAAEKYNREGEPGDVAREGGLDGSIYPFMLENAADRLYRAIEKTGAFPELVLSEIETQRSQLGATA